jgi:hypothetical protein
VIGPVSGSGAAETTTIAAGATVAILSAYSGTATFAGSTGTLQLYDPSSYTGTVAGLTGQDTLDLATINSATVHTPTYSGNSSGGTLSLTDGINNANIACWAIISPRPLSRRATATAEQISSIRCWSLPLSAGFDIAAPRMIAAVLLSAARVL